MFELLGCGSGLWSNYAGGVRRHAVSMEVVLYVGKPFVVFFVPKLAYVTEVFLVVVNPGQVWADFCEPLVD